MKKKILILGGTMFAGRILVEKLITQNKYDLTLFNRGKSNANLFPKIKQLHGNRETSDIAQIYGQHWDVVIDFSGYYPKTFQNLLENLRGNVGRYIFISTISVFQMGEKEEQQITESTATLECSETQQISALPVAYGEKKAEMERILLAEKAFDRIILRPSFIYGRYDFTDRFYYWVYRAKRQQKILLLTVKSLALTFVEDLVKGILAAIEIPTHKSIYKVINHTKVLLEDVQNITANLLDKEIEIIPATDEFLKKNELDYYLFPICLPFDLKIDGTAWLKDFNITNTDFIKSLEACMEFYETKGWPIPKVGLTPEKEQQLLTG